MKSPSHVQLLATLWTAAYQIPPSMGRSRQKYWSGVPLPSLISSLTTSNLPWFMDLTFQVPMQYCSFHHRTFTFTTRHIHNLALFLLRLSLFIPSGAISSIFSSSILHTSWPEEFIFQHHIILPFILFMIFSRQECWSGLPFPSPVDHVLSELSTMTRIS